MSNTFIMTDENLHETAAEYLSLRYQQNPCHPSTSLLLFHKAITQTRLTSYYKITSDGLTGA